MTIIKEENRQYRKTAKQLSVYMPLVHWFRSEGFARALRLNGHLNYMSGSTFKPLMRYDHKVSSDFAIQNFGPNVRVYEENEIYQNPPDIFVVGREDDEDTSLALWQELSKIKPIALIAYSGVFQTRYNWPLYRGVICTDLPSRVIARYHDVPAIRYMESFDFDSWPYVPAPESTVLKIRSYINDYEERFPTSYKFFQNCRNVLKSSFGSKVEIENFSRKSREELRAALHESSFTLHIKENEGFGWSIMESLSTGRPIIVQSGFAKDMAFNEWIEYGSTGYKILCPEDIIPIVDNFINNPNKLALAQQSASSIVRKNFDGISTAQDLVQFLEDVHRVECARWIPTQSTKKVRRSVSLYEPTLDPEYVQDFERIWIESYDLGKNI